MHGRYIRLDYCGIGNLVDDLERFFRLDHRVLKYMTIQLDKDVDPAALEEALKSEEAQPQNQAEAAQTTESAEGDVTEADEETLSEQSDQPESNNEE
jgi:small subunit ribosomal protein S6